jgi:hypothetical protein
LFCCHLSGFVEAYRVETVSGRRQGRGTQHFFGTLPTAVGQLKGDFATVLMNRFRHSAKTGDHFIVMDTALAILGFSMRVDIEMTRNYQADTSFGENLVTPDDVIGDLTVTGRCGFMSGGMDKPVFHLHPTNLDGLKHNGHGILLRGLAVFSKEML